MGKQRSSSGTGPGRRAWRLLRLALLWARKGGLLKCKLMAELRHGAKYLKAGLNQKHHAKDMIRYGERELSFDETPIIHLKMSRPASLRFMIPCMKPDVVDFDYDFGDDDYDGVFDGGRRSFLGRGTGDYDGENGDNQCDHDQDQEQGVMMMGMGLGDEDEGIDDKAEEFIAKFYQQMKLQREISFQRRHNPSNYAPIQVS